MKAKFYSAEVNGAFATVKAFYKENAVSYFRTLNGKIKPANVFRSHGHNSHQASIESCHPEMCKRMPSN